MSEVSVLFQQLETASELSQRVNPAVIDIKKARLGILGPDPETEQGLADRRRLLSEALCDLLTILSPDAGADEARREGAARRVPRAVAAELRERRRGDLTYYLEELQTAKTHLDRGVADLSDGDIALLDEFAAAAGTQAAAVLRRLVRT